VLSRQIALAYLHGSIGADAVGIAVGKGVGVGAGFVIDETTEHETGITTTKKNNAPQPHRIPFAPVVNGGEALAGTLTGAAVIAGFDATGATLGVTVSLF